MSNDPTYPALLDGRAPTVTELTPLVFAGYAHFTAFQARGGRLRGLDFHLERLRAASLELFARARDDAWVCERLREALAAAPADCSVTATAFVPGAEFTSASGEPSLLVRTGPPSDGPEGPLALSAVEHERYAAHIKHVGEPAKTHLLRRANAAGFDDAAFLDRRGDLTEATIWNLAFWDDESVVWPRADALPGTTMRIVKGQLERRGVEQRTEPVNLARASEMAGAVVMNSWTPGVAVRRIGDVSLPAAPAFLELLHDAYAAEPPALP